MGINSSRKMTTEVKGITNKFRECDQRLNIVQAKANRLKSLRSESSTVSCESLTRREPLTVHSVISPLLQIKKRILPTFASNNPLPMFLGGKRIKSIHSEIPIPLLFEENYLLRSFFKD